MRIQPVKPAKVESLVVRLDGTRELSREQVGGKAWSINNLRALGLPVPPAVVIGTEHCRDFYAAGQSLDDNIWKQVVVELRWIEKETGRTFGDNVRPLLLSVRSGSARSMPGMMDTVVNLGINAEIADVLAQETGDADYAIDTLNRFHSQYSRVVLGVTGSAANVPNEPLVQLRAAVEAVFRSWQSPRAVTYRVHNGLDHDMGTAVTIQAMVFGNVDDRSGSGVIFSRNPLDGSAVPYGEWIPRAQGEDVVSGSHTPHPLSSLLDLMPEVHAEVLAGVAVLEADGKDLQDVEFTIEAGTLWFLQSRAAKRAPRAAVVTAVAFWREGLISDEEALGRVTADQVRQLLKPGVDAVARAGARVLAKGEPACPGLASGLAVGTADEAEALAEDGMDVVLVTTTTSPDDVHGMIAATAVVTEQGGSTSHAAVVSREIGRPCVVACGNGVAAELIGSVITVDGATGHVLSGVLSLQSASEHSDPDLAQILDWAERRAPVTVVSPHHAPKGTVDLDEAGPLWAQRLSGAPAVTGRPLGNDESLSEILAAGVPVLVATHRLPVLLAVLALST